MPNANRPFQIVSVGGHTFEIFEEYDNDLEMTILSYPDFEENPVFTSEGRPFATAAQESCSHNVSQADKEAASDDCGGCHWFYRETSPIDLIGICMCDALKQRI